MLNKEKFISFILDNGILSFGDFTLKSGRKSPYFFNTGKINNGELVTKMAGFYSEFMFEKNIIPKSIFGPAYKGIPIAVAVSMSFLDLYNKNIGFIFNRKEAKEHGEKGVFVGGEISNDMVVLDDILTAGTAIRETLTLLKDNKVKPKAILVAIDRQAKGSGDKFATEEISNDFDIPVHSLVTLQDIIDFVVKYKLLDKDLIDKLSN
jgi:orotate phosphoribosyltransferase